MVFIIGALLFFLSSIASERILLFSTDITVQADASMSVVETITVHATGDAINHGIVREFPTSYKDRGGNRYKVAFQLHEVCRDGQQEPYHMVSVSNGKKVYIGSKEAWLDRGNYIYTISYTTNRQLGFFNDHDELYWNVTGNGWRLPIDRAIAIVHMPLSIPRAQLQGEAYTGVQGSKKQHALCRLDERGDLIFETTRPLRTYEGLTIVVTWPKGFMIPPSWWQEWWWFFQDNLHMLVALFGLLCLLGWYCIAWLRIRATQSLGTVIPLFYPPLGMTPGLMRYINRMGYDAQVLAADIVDMGVHGFLTIDYKPSFLKNRYMLHKKQEPGADVPHYILLYTTLFGSHDTIAVDERQALRINAAIDIEKNSYAKQSHAYFQSPRFFIALGIGIALIFSGALLFCTDADSRYLVFIAVFVYVWLTVGFFSLLRAYSKEGLPIKREIEGFKMFLATTEEERLKIIGTPPTRTPELYEKYLPYAMALNVEKQWSRQFAPLFEEMRKRGNPYVFAWYGGDFHAFNSSAFASTISRSISSSISSASHRPGSSSGSGGQGSSGGGGGGGGGGGW